jgi:hypothetical protein
MKTKLGLLVSTAFILFVTSSAFAQGSDVCCVLGKKSGESAETFATVRAPNECKGDNGYIVCASKTDPNNECSMLGDKERCGMCGFFWAGKACLAEDPVQKAKEQLKKEEADKKKKKKKGEEEAP